MPIAPPLEYWRYRIRLASLSLVRNSVETFPFEGAVIYSGHPPFRCDPSACNRLGGPIPTGWWTIGAPFESKHTGHYVLSLTPWRGTETHGRSAFQFHGENTRHVGLSSDGCLVSPVGGLWIREKVHASGISPLLVEAS